MSITPYLIGGTAVVVGLAVGYAKWTEKGAALATSRAETATVAAECATVTAADVNDSMLQRIAELTTDLNKQKDELARVSAKSGERLRALNRLTKEIANAKDNAPIPDALESVLNDERMRSAVAGSDTPASGADEGGSPAPIPADRPVVSDPAAPTS